MDAEAISQVAAALSTVHCASTSSESRQNAQAFLDEIKTKPDAALIGYTLALPTQGNTGYLRHYGLSLLHHVVRYQFVDFDDDQRLTVRGWIKDLAGRLDSSDPHYIREKLSFLWVAVAKRIWGLDSRVDRRTKEVAPTDGWTSFDSDLLALWNNGSVSSDFSLSVLRNLFEDLYMLDDPVAARRTSVLSAQCIEIVTPAQDLFATYHYRVPALQRLRADDEGWISRWVRSCNEYVGQKDPESELLLTHVLETLKVCLHWGLTRTIVSNNILELFFKTLKHKSVRVRIVTCDCLHALRSRNYSDQDDFNEIIGKMFAPAGIKWLTEVYASIHIDPDNVDDLEYVFLKKYIEMIVGLGEYIDTAKTDLPQNSDITGYLRLMLEIARNPSLLASGLSLQFWCSLLRLDRLLSQPEVNVVLPDLLALAVERCVRYELMPDSHPAKKFMSIDFDSNPEASTFYGSYYQYMEDIVRLVVCQIPVPSLIWLHGQVGQFFESQLGWQVMNQDINNQSSPAFILGCAQISLVDAAVRGVVRWQVCATERDQETEGPQILELVEQWAREMLSLRVSDPVILRKLIECLVQFAPLLHKNIKIMFQILERVLNACTYDFPPDGAEFDEQRDRVRDLRAASSVELNRLAYMVPETLLQIYDDLERVIGEVLSSPKVREYESIGFKSFLLVVSQRSSMPNKEEKFAAVVDPVLQSWTDPETMKGLMDLEWLMERIGIVEIAQYFRSRNITAETNLLETPMDEQGRLLKAELKQKWQAIFPIRPTRVFIQYTIERLDHSSPEYQHLLRMWKPRITPILPHILQLISQIMAYHNPANWQNLPPEVRNFVEISCTERFWQVGVSTLTKDEFDNLSVKASKTVRDFADSVGHIVRYTREYGFMLLGTISQLEETIYEVPNMGQMLFQALAGHDSVGITSHCWRHIISLVVRPIVKNCPQHLISSFLPEFLPLFLRKMDDVLSEKWEARVRDGLQMSDEMMSMNDTNDLSEEMMDECLLRQLTSIVLRLMIDLVGQTGTKMEQYGHRYLLRQLCRTNEEILGSILTLCRHIMVFKDSQCCFNTCLILRNLIVDDLLVEQPAVGSFFVSEITPACLQILADPHFHESHNEAGLILTHIYTVLRPISEEVRLRFQQLIPSADAESLDTLEKSLNTSKTLKQQKGVMMDFLSMHGVLQIDDESRSRSQKRLEYAASRQKDWNDSYDAVAVVSMFNDNR